jgi:hypothetical protein
VLLDRLTEGLEFIVTEVVTADVVKHPNASFTVKLYVPAAAVVTEEMLLTLSIIHFSFQIDQ